MTYLHLRDPYESLFKENVCKIRLKIALPLKILSVDECYILSKQCDLRLICRT